MYILLTARLKISFYTVYPGKDCLYDNCNRRMNVFVRRTRCQSSSISVAMREGEMKGERMYGKDKLEEQGLLEGMQSDGSDCDATPVADCQNRVTAGTGYVPVFTFVIAITFGGNADSSIHFEKKTSGPA